MATRRRFPIFTKIFLSCLALAGTMIALSYGYARYRESKMGRGRYLETYLKRYADYQQGMGDALASVADIIAADATLRLSLSPETKASAAVESMMGGADAKRAGEIDDEARERAAERAAEILDSLSGKNAVAPTLFVVFDRHARLVFMPPETPIVPGELRELEAVARVRAGNAFFNKLMLQKGKVYQVAGVPIRLWNGADVAGGILLGVPIERHFAAFQRQSDELEKDQVRLTLVRNNEVLASAFPPSSWPDLAESVSQGRRRRVQDGPDLVDVVSFDKQQWDYAVDRVTGYVGAEQAQLGQLVMLKSRAGVERPPYAFAAATGVALALVVAWLLAIWITRPVRRFTEATSEISEGAGDLTKRIDVTSNDELGDLANNLNRLFANLQSLATDVQGASLQVGASSAEISAASKQMLEGAKDQAVKIESSTAAVTELSTSIQQVAANATEATKVARQSNESVASAISSMNQIRHTVEEAAEKIQELGESGKRIGNIVEVIRQISEQTSLLALNASIEAAHAGEQGRGFAVVADEVSSLARRVGQSAKDIEDLIATIKDQTSDAVRTMQTGTREVEVGTEKVTTTLENLKHIVDVIQDTAKAVQEQAIVSDEIARSMDAVQKIAGEVVSSSEEAVIQGEQLHKLAHKLEESVRGFNLDGDARVDDSAPVLPHPRPARELSRPRAARKG
jgi:methyl-accepting chemotaxis protein